MPSAYDKFIDALNNKSAATKKTYNNAFLQFVGYYGIKNSDDLLGEQPSSLEDRITGFLKTLTSYAIANKMFWAIHLFCSANRIRLDWEHVKLFMPKQEEKEQTDRPYTHEEVSTLITEADLRTKVAIFIMATGGPRKGALPGIRIDKDLIWIAQHDTYCLHIYPLDKKNHYYTFVTPQASQFIDEYKGKRKTGFLFVNKRDATLPISDSVLSYDIWQLLVKTGLRTPSQTYKRQDVQLDHGFRKFFRTTLDICGIEEHYAERLLGHGRGLVKVYSLPDVMEWMQVTKYYNAIQTLTF